MAKLIKPDGTEIEVTPKKGTHFSMEELQEYVGGYFELVPQSHLAKNYLPKTYLLVDEDGLMKQLPFNQKASKIAGRTIVGSALLCNNKEFK